MQAINVSWSERVGAQIISHALLDCKNSVEEKNKKKVVISLFKNNLSI